MIPLKITVRHSKITDEFKSYAEEKVEHLHKYLDRIKHIEIILDHAKNNFTAEIIVSAVRGKKLVGKSTDRNYFTALDETMEKMEKQLTKFKELLKYNRTKDFSAPAMEEPAFGSGLEQNDWY